MFYIQPDVKVVIYIGESYV